MMGYTEYGVGSAVASPKNKINATSWFILLLGIKWARWRRVIDLDASSLLFVAVGHWQSPPSLFFGRGQPQAEEVPARNRGESI